MRIGLVTLGCDKNTVDNEYLGGLLDQRGHEVMAADPASDGCDAVVITTCGFIDIAKGQSLEAIEAWARAKRERGRPRKLIVAGCLTQRYSEQILARWPEIDGLAGVGRFDELARLIEESDPQGGHVCLSLADKPSVEVVRLLPRRRLESRPFAHLKIADGCDHACAFCSIPLMKGKNRSVPEDVLVDEARRLIAQGVREIDLVAQDLALYGRDQKRGRGALPSLLRRLCSIEGDFWIRLFYVYPGGVTDELLETMAAEPKICRYLDMPLQHLSPPVLKAMRRPWREVNTEALIGKIRAALPDITLRTTFIVGFPGETDADFDCLLDGLRRLRIERVGAFKYSLEDGTRAFHLPNPVEPAAAAERQDRLMRAQQEIAFALNQDRAGQTATVLVDEFDASLGALVARSHAEAPDIDGRILIAANDRNLAGRFVDAQIERADGYDVWASILPPRTPA